MRPTLTLFIVTAIFALVMSGHGYAGQMEHGGTMIRLDHAWARRAPMLGQEGPRAQSGGTTTHGNGAVYVTVTNRGHEPDALLSATTDAAATVELHETVHQGGTMRMQPLARLEIPAGGQIEMKPGGYHLMLLGLRRDLKPGDTVAVDLRFAKAGQISVQAPVQ
jgi:periplasmic copper chaperone A